jgi:photosystem II stability/assembly factor-like uncharacterized protein
MFNFSQSVEAKMTGNTNKRPQDGFGNMPAWGIFGFFMTAILGLFLAGCLGTPPSEQFIPAETQLPPTMTFTLNPGTPTLPPPTVAPTATASPEPTSIPLVWKQIYDGQAFMRDTVVSIVSDDDDSQTISITTANSGDYTTTDWGVSWIPAQTNHVQPDELFQVRWQGLDRSGRTVNYRINQENYTYLEKSIDNNNWIPIQKLTSWFYSNGPFAMGFNPITKQAAFFSNRFLLYKTQDAGNSWFKVYDFPTKFIATIEVSAASPETVYAGTQGFFISEDGGSQWQEHSQGIGSIRTDLLINSDNSRFYLLERGSYSYHSGYGDRIFRILHSRDGGLTWEIFSEQYGLGLSFGPGKTLYYSLDSGAILKFGDRWESELFGYYGLTIYASHKKENTLFSIDPNKSRWNNSGEPSPIRVSLDDGKTWQETNGAFKNADTEDRLKLYFDHDQGAVVYAVLNNSILRSDNGGQSWENCLYDIPLVDSESNLAIDPSNSSIVYVISETKGFYVSSNGCENWQQRNIGLPYLGLNSIATDPIASNVIYAGTQSGAYISYDQGEHWGQINDGLIGSTIVYSIAVDSQSNVYATTPNGVFRLERR